MKTFLILLLIGFALRFLMPYIIRFALKYFVQKQMRKAQQYAQQSNGQAPPFMNNGQRYQSTSHGTQKGKIKVDYVPEEKRERKDFPGGEYVDYEEIK